MGVQHRQGLREAIQLGNRRKSRQISGGNHAVILRYRNCWRDMAIALTDQGSERRGLFALSAFQAAPRKTIITENSIHTIKPIAAATPL
jgi:hypothetical protein